MFTTQRPYNLLSRMDFSVLRRVYYTCGIFAYAEQGRKTA